MKCGVCRHDCDLAEGQTGICGVRKNEGGKIVLQVYGKASSSALDPMEKKPLFHVKPGTQILSIGSIGCNFRCCFCQNWEISQAMHEPDLKDQIPLTDLQPQQIVDYAVEHDIHAIAFTYNEPAILLEYALDTFKLAKKKGITTVFVSNGYASDASLKKLKGYLDAINIDLKAFSADFYAKQCKARFENVLATIESAFKMGFWIELTTLLIPGLNDSEDELTKAAQWIADLSKDIPWHITAFHPDYKLTHIPPTTTKQLGKAYDIAKKAGLNYVYVGNMRTPHENTLCPACGVKLVEREGFYVLNNNIRNGKCPKCKQEVPGLW